MQRAVCFDLGGTLIHRERARDMCMHWERHGVRIEAGKAEAAVYRSDCFFMEHCSNLWRQGGRAFHHHYWSRVHTELGLAAPGVAACSSWGGPWQHYGDALGTLHRLRDAGYVLALLSNWDATATEVLTATGLTQWFDVIGISAELGREKPDPKAFLWIADALNLPPDQITHIGDNAWDDALGAHMAGMRAVLVHRHPEWQAAPTLPEDVPVVSDLGTAIPYLLHPVSRVLAGRR